MVASYRMMSPSTGTKRSTTRYSSLCRMPSPVDAVSAGWPSLGPAPWPSTQVSSLKFLPLDHAHVVFPAAAGVAHRQPDARIERGAAAIERDDPRHVVPLVHDHDRAGPLQNLVRVVVDRRVLPLAPACRQRIPDP